MKATPAILLCLAVLVSAAAPTTAEPPEGFVCPVGYNPTALANACINPEPDLPDGNRTYCLVGDICASTPILIEGGRTETLAYVDAACTQTDDMECGCAHFFNGPLFGCLPIFSGPETDPHIPVVGEPEQGPCPTTCPPLVMEPLDPICVLGYRPSAYVNVCLTGEGVLQVVFFGGDTVCVVGEQACAFIPHIYRETPLDPSPVTVHAEVLCNQPQGCGCMSTAWGLVEMCTPIHG